MPRKAKEEVKIKAANKTTKKDTRSVKKETKPTKKAIVPIPSSAKKTSTKKNTAKTNKTVKETATKAKTSKTTKKTATKAKVSKASISNKKTSKVKSEFVSIMEYYDLPYRYNQTIVKILAQTPQMLFVYWDISDTDRIAFENAYGSDFFSKTTPVLIIHNETMNYSFEIEINDFANSWYLHVNDANCKYIIELGRRPFKHTSTINTDYIYISSSDEMNTPNNHVLFEKFNPNVTYKNIKTGNTTSKDFSNISNFKNMKEIYNIYDLYKSIYKNELFEEISGDNLLNPSSMSSSNFNKS